MFASISILLLITLVSTVSSLLTQISSRATWQHAAEITGFNWSEIEPTSSLRWTKCHESYECARLSVPLDWTDLENPHKVALALTRVPAAVPITDPTFAGSILINPGGPGGSGTDEVLWSGFGVRDNIVDSSDKHFEIVSWDPRGVHHTTPKLTCSQSDWERDIWQYRNWAVGQLGLSDSAFDVKWATFESFANLCNQSAVGKFEDGTNMHQFVSTALTAHDMVAIIDALQVEHNGARMSAQDEQVQVSIKQKSEPALLNFWGWSYGTYLGNTFASMFPERIGHMVLDGNVDPVDYTATGWLSNLFDNDKNLHWFYYSCFQAGTKCALFDADTKTLFDVQKKVEQLLDSFKGNPLAVVHDGAADVVTYADPTNLVHGAAYAPRYFWPEVAQIMHDLMNGNGTSIVKYLKNLQIPQSPDPIKPEPPYDALRDNQTLPYPPDYSGGLEGAVSILCGDGEPLTHLTKNDWAVRISQLQNQSSIAGPFWAAIPFACQHWPAELRPAERNRFTGPFLSRLADYDDKASPILFIGNTADPVTPLRNALKNSRDHEGSRVLIQDSPGHCAGPVNPSNCTFGVIPNFFGNGTMPEISKVCSGSPIPWGES